MFTIAKIKRERSEANKSEVIAFKEFLGEYVGGLLRQKRKSLGLSQSEMCEFLSVTQTAYSSWEIGVRVPKIHYLYELAAVFGCSVADFLPSGMECVAEHGGPPK